jgi:hypothetical protein
MLVLPAVASSSGDPSQNRGASSIGDHDRFYAFVESRPTPEQFQSAYPDVWLILPGDIVSREVCSQYYRYVAELDAQGRITGGSLE